MTGRTDRWIKRTTVGRVGMLALIAGTVSYLHMHLLVQTHGQPGWVAALTPLSVDGMIVAASTTLLADSRGGGRGGFLPWALLVAGSAASLAANVAVAEPTATGRAIAAWPSFSLIAAYELLMRQVRRAADARPSGRQVQSGRSAATADGAAVAKSAATSRPADRVLTTPRRAAGPEVWLDAWRSAQDNRSEDGSLPSGREIARQYGRTRTVGPTGQTLGTGRRAERVEHVFFGIEASQRCGRSWDTEYCQCRTVQCRPHAEGGGSAAWPRRQGAQESGVGMGAGSSQR